MKANEAPEKIYVQLPSRNWIGKTWNETPIKEGDNPNWKNATNIEYTRTDSFVEKAQLFLIGKLKEIPMGDGKMKIKAECSLEGFIEDFVKYMEE